MDKPILRLLIQGKIGDGRLPPTPCHAMWGGRRQRGHLRRLR